MEIAAVVTRIEGRFAWVKITRQSGGCGRCHEPGGCGGVQITQAMKSAGEEFRLPNDIGAEPGQSVRVWVADGAPLRASMLSYGLPLVGLLLGALVGTSLAAGAAVDLGGLAGGMAGIGVALVLSRRLYRCSGWREGMQVRLLDGQPGCGHSGGGRP